RMRAEWGPKPMRAQAIAADAASLPECLELARKVLPGEVALGAEGRKQPFRFGVALGCRAKLQIVRHRAFGLRIERHEPFLASLAAHNQHALVASRRGCRQCHKFRYTQAGGIDDFQKT